MAIEYRNAFIHSFTGDRLFPISNRKECFSLYVYVYITTPPLYVEFGEEKEEEEKNDEIKLNAATMN